MSKRKRAYLLLLINTIVWGAFLPIVKWGFNESDITPFRFLLYRLALAAVLSIPLIRHYWPKLKKKGQAVWRISALELLGTTLALAFLYAGLNRGSALETNLIASALPVFIVVGGVLFLGEKLHRQEKLGLLLAFSGAMILISEPLWQGQNQQAGSLLANFFIIIYNLLTAAYLLLAKKYYKRLPKFFVVGVSFVVGALSFALLSLWEMNFDHLALLRVIAQDLSDPRIVIVVLYAAVFGSLIGLTTYIKGQDGIEASEASLFNYLQPAVYIPLGVLLLGESLWWWQLAALGVIIYGVYLASKR